MSATRTRTVWRYGDALSEKGRIIRNGPFYYALLRVDNVRWRVLAGCWAGRGLAFRAMCTSHMRRTGEWFTETNFDRDLAEQTLEVFERCEGCGSVAECASAGCRRILDEHISGKVRL